MSRVDNMITDLLDTVLDQGASHLYLFSGLTPRYCFNSKWTAEVEASEVLETEELKDDFLSLEITVDEFGKGIYTHLPVEGDTEYVVFAVDVSDYKSAFEVTFKVKSRYEDLTMGAVND